MTKEPLLFYQAPELRVRSLVSESILLSGADRADNDYDPEYDLGRI